MAQLWFKFWAKEYLADAKVRCLTYEQRGILQTLWAFAWEEGSIPSDESTLGTMLGIPAKAMRTHMQWVNRFFHPSIEDASRLISPRLELDRAEADAKGSKARESALARWSKVNANAYADASNPDMPPQCDNPCVDHAGQGQGHELTKTPTPSGPGKAKREPKPKVLGDWPAELDQAVSVWRELGKTLRSPEVLEKFGTDQTQYLAQVGTKGKVWDAWQKRLQMVTPTGRRIESVDVLEAVKMWADVKLQQARAGKRLSCPMLPSLINSPDFEDALLRATELPHAV